MDTQSVSINLTLTPRAQPAVDTRMTLIPEGEEMAILAHDYMSADGAHQKPDYEPRGFNLPETEKRVHPEHTKLEKVKAKLWFRMFELCAPKTGLEKLPMELRWADDLKGNWHLWLDDAWYNRLNALEQQWLFLIYWSRALTNKVHIDVPGYIDEVTGFGLPDEFGKFQPGKMEGVTTCGNVIWKANGVAGAGFPVWCLDGLATEFPPAEEILKWRPLVHAFTISTTNNWDKTPRPGAPRGTWDVISYGILNGNAVPIPQFATWDDDKKATRVWNGIPLRADWYNTDRILPYAEPWNPYNPPRPLFPRG